MKQNSFEILMNNSGWKNDDRIFISVATTPLNSRSNPPLSLIVHLLADILNTVDHRDSLLLGWIIFSPQRSQNQIQMCGFRQRSQRIAAALNVRRLWQGWISPSIPGLMCAHLIPNVFLCWRRKLSSNCQKRVFLRFRVFSCCLILQAASHRSLFSVSRSVGFYASNSHSQKKYEVITTVSVFPCTKA